MENIILLGAGGHCKVVLDSVLDQKKFKVVGIIDVPSKVGAKVLGVPIVGSDSDLPKYRKKGIGNCFLTIGSIGNPELRIGLYKLAKRAGFKFPNIISLDAIVSPYIKLGEGNYIAPGAIVNAGAVIGDNCIVNTGAIVEHDCILGDFVHISPGSILSGGVQVGNNTHIGSGASVIQYIKIGSGAFIGAGSVVTKNIGNKILAFGNPAKKQRVLK